MIDGRWSPVCPSLPDDSHLEPEHVQTVILCGGRGTRAYPHTVELPKPLLEVAGEPILGHVLRIYAEQGFEDFILAGGYLIERIEEFARSLPPSWTVEVVDTGEETNTGGRIAKVAHLVDGTFMANYSDGLADIDLGELLEFHESHDALATLTTVPLLSQYGTIEHDHAGQISRFLEKPLLPEHRINGGYFVFEPEALDHWAGEDLEREVLPALAAEGHLYAYHHHGFWRSMDTYKDALELTGLAEEGVPWHRE